MDKFQEGGKSGEGKTQEDNLLGASFLQKSFPLKNAETIAAVATPPGSGAVAVLRLSGPRSLDILTRLFRPLSPSFAGFKPRLMHYGQILACPLPDDSPPHSPDPDNRGSGGRRSGGGNPKGMIPLGFPPPEAPPLEILDEVLAVFMPGPGTFTGEDVVEIHCHGGVAVTDAVLAAVLAAGARLATPGEFTRRAFLNGRLDLSQAEAVAECIAANSPEALALAQAKLGGLMGRRARELRERLRGLCAQLVVAVDFPEEDVEILPRPALAAEVEAVRRACADLAAGYERTRLARQGALVVLAGQVNVGKSSLMNALLGRERAIVTPHPGTTRDFLEETLDLAGLPVRLVDTAGLRDAHDPVEAEGLRRARELMAEADLVLWVTDVEHDPDDPALAAESAELTDLASDRVLGLLNKIDLLPAAGETFSPPGPAEASTPESGVPGRLKISARTGAGLEDLAAAIRARLLENAVVGPDADAQPAPNLRQRDLLLRAEEELAGLLADLDAGLPCDILGVRADLARDVLAEITGEIAADDVLDLIFAEFCLGK